LKELVSKITFKDGQRYTDYQIGDKIAGVGLKEIVMGDESSGGQRDEVKAGSVPGVVIWIYSVFGACVALGSGMLVYGRFKKRKTQPAAVATNGHALPAVHHNGGKKNGNGMTRHAASRQKKVFNYHKFYWDMVLETSGLTYGWESSVNGNSHSRTKESAGPQTIAGANANTDADLIAFQKTLIEEQKNLMREQSRIIEEKAKLIEKYSQLMEKWSQDVENQFSLKLD
jgi:hypothetical protein